MSFDRTPLALSGPMPPPAFGILFVANALFWVGVLLALALVFRWTCAVFPRVPGAKSMTRVPYPRLLLLLLADVVAIAAWDGLFLSAWRT